MDCTASSVCRGEGPWTDRQRVILRVVDEQLATYTNTPGTIRDAVEMLGHAELVEVLIILGTYSTLARIINGLRIDDDQPIRPDGLEDMLRASVTQ